MIANIDRKSPIPLYVQVKRAIKKNIENGEWPPGFKLPGEPELCETFDVSRTVIRQALGDLATKGLIVRSRGKGTFVAEPKIQETFFQKLSGFYEDMVAQGYEPRTEILEKEIVSANNELAKYLEVDEGKDIFKLKRLRFVENVPICLVTSYIPYELCEGLDKENLSSKSLYRTLEKKYGLFISSGERTIEAVPANEYEAEVLETEEGSPLVLLNSISYLDDERPIEYYHAVHRGDRAKFKIELVRSRNLKLTMKDYQDNHDFPQGNALVED